MVRKIQNDISRDPTVTSSSTEETGDSGVSQEVCPICGGKGFYVLDVPPGHPDFGRAIPCVCQREVWQRRSIAQLQRISHLEHLQDKTFETFSLREEKLPSFRVENLRAALNAARRFAEQPRGWLLLTGGLGCGKTHLAAAIANERIRRGEPALFIVVPDLLDYLRASFQPGSGTSYDERFEEIRAAPLLILDDLGAESATSWAMEKLYQLINFRYNARLPTVFTTNARLDQIEERIRSRLLDHALTTVCHLRVPDYRVQEAMQKGPELDMLPYLGDMTFATWDERTGSLSRQEQENLERALSLAQAYAEQPQNWLVFAGPSGSGKTHLAAAIANERVRRGDDVLFVVVPDLLDYLRAAFSPESRTPYDRRFEEVKRVRVLVLDDLGTESATPWAREKLYQLLNFRYNAHLPTIITTSKAVDELDERIRTRILDPRRSVVFGLIVRAYLGDPEHAKRRKRRSTPPRNS